MRRMNVDVSGSFPIMYSTGQFTHGGKPHGTHYPAPGHKHHPVSPSKCCYISVCIFGVITNTCFVDLSV